VTFEIKPPNRRVFLQAAASWVGAYCLSTAPRVYSQARAIDDETIRNILLQLVNQERLLAGVPAVAIDGLACKVAREHALDMASGFYLSHWERDGRKPYQRYSLAGGVHAIAENVSAIDNILSFKQEDIAQDISYMHVKMYNEVPPNDGHRKSILAPQQTHVGFGVALNQRSLRLTEEYIARYIELDDYPRKAKIDASILLTGKLLNKKYELLGADVFYEPLPKPIAADSSPPYGPYSLPAERETLRLKAPRGMFYKDGSLGSIEVDDGRFRVPVRLFRSEPCLYTVLFWIRTRKSANQFPAALICIQAE
jgi:uncharacterized protein YkwD